jgi:hypothetical protein
METNITQKPNKLIEDMTTIEKRTFLKQMNLNEALDIIRYVAKKKKIFIDDPTNFANTDMFDRSCNVSKITDIQEYNSSTFLINTILSYYVNEEETEIHSILEVTDVENEKFTTVYFSGYYSEWEDIYFDKIRIHPNNPPEGYDYKGHLEVKYV